MELTSRSVRRIRTTLRKIRLHVMRSSHLLKSISNAKGKGYSAISRILGLFYQFEVLLDR